MIWMHSAHDNIYYLILQNDEKKLNFWVPRKMKFLRNKKEKWWVDKIIPEGQGNLPQATQVAISHPSAARCTPALFRTFHGKFSFL